MTSPLVVQYLYVHDVGESFHYPTARSAPSSARVAARYLECAVTQAASLALRETDCEMALVINTTEPQAIGREGVRLVERLRTLGVAIVRADYRHRPGAGAAHLATYMSSRYLLDAILAACAGQPGDRQVWLTDLDCVWVDPPSVFAAAPAPPRIGHVEILYPPEWDPVGSGGPGTTRRALGEMAGAMGGSGEALPPWIGGELLTGRPAPLRELVSACEEIDELLSGRGEALPTEEQILTLAGALGRVSYEELSHVVRRILTGPRHGAPPVEEPTRYGLWHLPSEKGLSLRRAAREILAGHEGRLRRDLADPARMARRFNVEGTGLRRRLRDDGWLAGQKMQRALLSVIGLA